MAGPPNLRLQERRQLIQERARGWTRQQRAMFFFLLREQQKARRFAHGVGGISRTRAPTPKTNGPTPAQEVTQAVAAVDVPAGKAGFSELAAFLRSGASMAQVVAGVGPHPTTWHQDMESPPPGSGGQYLIDFQPGASGAERIVVLLEVHADHHDQSGPWLLADAGAPLRPAARVGEKRGGMGVRGGRNSIRLSETPGGLARSGLEDQRRVGERPGLTTQRRAGGQVGSCQASHG